jgi:tRNA threonylcarbamoyladenosine biosynthesis protein TsaE
MKKFFSKSQEDTRKIGGELLQEYNQETKKRALVFALEGKLGAGKTQLVKGMALAMGIKDQVISPTFTLEAEYDLGNLIHIDAWRLENSNELLEMGFEKRVEDKSLVVIEWADQVKDILKKLGSQIRVIWVKLSYGEKENERIIEVWEEK